MLHGAISYDVNDLVYQPPEEAVSPCISKWLTRRTQHRIARIQNGYRQHAAGQRSLLV